MSVLLLMHAGRAYAQGGPVRHGFWLDYAEGQGWAHMTGDTAPRSAVHSGGITNIDLGWTFGSRVRVGVGAGQWARELGGGMETWLTSYGITAYYYPVARRSAFLQVEAGGSYYALVHVPWGGEAADTTYLSGTAWGATVAVGWDVRLGEIFTLRPRLAYSYGAPRSVRSADGTLLAAHWKDELLVIDVGMVLHPPDSW